MRADDRAAPGAVSELPMDLFALYGELIDADDQGDAPALARLGWNLFALVSAAEQAHHAASDRLNELRTAARATAAGDGSPASLALLRHVLARHGWLPPPDATPLQVLAEPPSHSCARCYESCLASCSLARTMAASADAASAASASPWAECASLTSVSARTW